MNPIKKIKWRDAVAVIAVVIIIVNAFNYLFGITITIQRKPPLHKVLTAMGLTAAKPKTEIKAATTSAAPTEVTLSQAETAAVLPPNGIQLPIAWGDLGKKLLDTGVVDEKKLTTLYASRGGVPPEMAALLKPVSGEIVMTKENAGALLNILWAVGLGTSNPILTKGEMSDPKNGGADGFASTGGWSLARGDVMKHYAAHNFIPLTVAEQKLVENVSKNIYRPCCGNSVHFPDCNHGMAMLGLLELMAKNRATEQQMYDTALVVNSYWFPDTYLTLAKYAKSRGVAWSNASPQELLGASYSSAQGYREILAQVSPTGSRGGGSCGVQ